MDEINSDGNKALESLPGQIYTTDLEIVFQVLVVPLQWLRRSIRSLRLITPCYQLQYAMPPMLRLITRYITIKCYCEVDVGCTSLTLVWYISPGLPHIGEASNRRLWIIIMNNFTAYIMEGD